MIGSPLTPEQEDYIQRLVTARLKSARHESDDHLDRGLPVQKVKPSDREFDVLASLSGRAGMDSVWSVPWHANLVTWDDLEYVLSYYAQEGHVH